MHMSEWPNGRPVVTLGCIESNNLGPQKYEKQLLSYIVYNIYYPVSVGQWIIPWRAPFLNPLKMFQGYVIRELSIVYEASGDSSRSRFSGEALQDSFRGGQGVEGVHDLRTKQRGVEVKPNGGFTRVVFEWFSARPGVHGSVVMAQGVPWLTTKNEQNRLPGKSTSAWGSSV